MAKSTKTDTILDSNTLYGYTVQGVIRHSRITNERQARTALVITDLYEDGEMAECIICFTGINPILANLRVNDILEEIDKGYLSFVCDVPKAHIKHLRKSLQ